jgi:hypothetical protein
MVRVKSFEKHWGSRVQSVEIEPMSSGAIGLRTIYLCSIQSVQSRGSIGSRVRPVNLNAREKTLRLHRQLHSLLSNQVARPCSRSSLPTCSATPKRTLIGLELSSTQQASSAHDPQGKEVRGVPHGEAGSCSIGIWT